LITTNLPSGYHRDMQILKENLFPVFNEMKECLRMTRFMLNRIEIVQISKDDKIYQNLYSVEAVNRLVQKGIPFRAAYQKIAEDIQQGKFKPPTDINYTHEGSIGNLQNDKIKEEMTKAIGAYNFKKVDASLLHLLKREYVIL
jgi:argininosuccinate lyase